MICYVMLCYVCSVIYEVFANINDVRMYVRLCMYVLLCMSLMARVYVCYVRMTCYVRIHALLCYGQYVVCMLCMYVCTKSMCVRYARYVCMCCVYVMLCIICMLCMRVCMLCCVCGSSYVCM